VTVRAPSPAENCRSYAHSLVGGRRLAAEAVFAALALGLAAPAYAEVGASLSLLSDYRFRGSSLSGDRPVLDVAASYDHASGAYLGASVVGVATAHSGLRILGFQEYAGYARRLNTGLTADVGLTHSNYSEYYVGHSETDYGQIYAGLITRHFSTHLYYSPRYFGYPLQTLYGEVEGVIQPARDWRLTGRLGMLTALNGSRRPGLQRTLYDWRIGLATQFKGLNLQLAVTGVGPDTDRDGADRHSREALVFGVTKAF
jgi:uncharacterized protein (TIGR02001 family)